MSAPTVMPPSLGHQPSLDGLRGVAIAAVLIFHADRAWLPGGFFGVDVFFVLSGFLITTLLLEEHIRTDRISLSAFFLRRVLRLYPALIALVIVSTVFTLTLHRDTGVERTLSVAASVLLYYANWLSMADTKGWFGGMPHTWSLAIEAQFYLLWAVVIAFFSRRNSGEQRRDALLKILALSAFVIAIASAGWRAALWAEGATWMRTYLATETRLDGVFLGALVAIVRLRRLTLAPSGQPAPSRRLAASLFQTVCAGVLLVLFTCTQFGSALPGHSGFFFTGLATAGLLLSVIAQPDALLSTLLRWRPLVGLGQISYSLYIWHVPASKLIKSNRWLAAGMPEWSIQGMRLLLTVIVSLASYYLIEKYFLRRKEALASPHPAVNAKLQAAAPDRITPTSF